MFKFSFSVRTYHEGVKFGKLPRFDMWDKLPDEVMRLACVKAAEGIISHGRSSSSAVELYRAAGYGVYNIYLELLPWGVPVERIRRLCNKYDILLHGPLD